MSSKLYHKTENRKRHYLEQYRNQGGRCAICGRMERLIIDHDRITGEMRGLLCYKHNSGLGMFEDSPTLLVSAAEYLRYHETRNRVLDYRKTPRQLANDELNREADRLLEDANFESDRARARELARRFSMSYPASQSRIARRRRSVSREGHTHPRHLRENASHKIASKNA